MSELARGTESPIVELERPVTQPPWYGFTGWYLRIHARNVDLVYVIGDYRPDKFAWEASWPD